MTNPSANDRHKIEYEEKQQGIGISLTDEKEEKLRQNHEEYGLSQEFNEIRRISQQASQKSDSGKACLDSRAIQQLNRREIDLLTAIQAENRSIGRGEDFAEETVDREKENSDLRKTAEEVRLSLQVCAAKREKQFRKTKHRDHVIHRADPRSLVRDAAESLLGSTTIEWYLSATEADFTKRVDRTIYRIAYRQVTEKSGRRR